MLITYFDEVKYAQGTQPYYWLGGLAVNADTIWALERKVAELSEANELSNFRTWGTRYNFGIDLTHLIDTVHFTASAHSRMLQLADVYVWFQQLCSNANSDHRKELADYVRHSTNLLRPTRYKEWPTSQSWIQVG